MEAGTRPDMVFVPKKSIEQQDIQCLHRIRSRLVKERTSLVNQVRGLLSEYGIVISKSVSKFRCKLPEIIENADNELTFSARKIFSDLYDELVDIDQNILVYEERLRVIYKENESCKLLDTVPGVGYLTGTAILSTIGDISVFKNGRHLAAYLGLVPRQDSSGSRHRLGKITKRGDCYLRTLIIHGGRSVSRVINKKDNPYANWIKSLKVTKHENVACVAVANKNARIIWSILKKREPFYAHELVNKAA